MKWFKFYGTEYLSDPKMLSLTPAERSCWITLLCYACINDNEDDNGKVKHLTEEKLMIQAGIDQTSEEWGKTKGILKKFEELTMIQVDNEVITIINWHKRQETNLTGYERVKRWRKKKRLDNAEITIEEKRRDKNRINKEEKLCLLLKNWNSTQTSPLQAFVPKNIVNKYGVEKIERLHKKYGEQNNGFSQFLSSLKEIKVKI